MAGCSRRSAVSKAASRLRQSALMPESSCEAELLQFDVPVAELVPEEVPERSARLRDSGTARWRG